MGDIVDQAQRLEQAQLEERLAAQAERAGLEERGLARCAECGERIPAARRRALPSAVRCLDCQDWFERTGDRT